jgi:hypothetical protein
MIDLRTGDCRAVLRGLAEASADAIVTDPPYELAFMGRKWDASGVAFLPETWAECLRVARPGAHLLAFGGTRTHHRLICAIEDAGWEVRDCLMWVYGSGFPKSLNVSAAIDKAAGAEREVVGIPVRPDGTVRPNMPNWQARSSTVYAQDEWTRTQLHKSRSQVTAPATDAARRWAGWGTALKPSHEIIVHAHKPLNSQGELDTIDGNLSILEARLWSLLPASVAVESFGSSPSEFAAACASVRWSADERSSTQAALSGLMDTSRSVAALISCLSIVQSWRGILGELFGAMSTSTTETASSTTTDLRTLRSLLSRTTPLCMLKAATRDDGLTFDALPVARAFAAVSSKLSSIRELSALASVTSHTPTSCRGEAAPIVCEPIVLARKPLDGTVAGNVLAYGTGALNIDKCRIPAPDDLTSDGHFKPSRNTYAQDEWTQSWEKPRSEEHPAGRWPPNFLLTHHPDCRPCGTKRVKGNRDKPVTSGNEGSYSGGWPGGGERPVYTDADGMETVEAWDCHESCPVRGLDAQAGERKSGEKKPHHRRNAPKGWSGPYSDDDGGPAFRSFTGGDSGGASRFYPTFAWETDDFAPYFYCPKASRAERGAGNTHPTVKPLALMRWLVRLVCPPGGTLLDPFCGSGSTLLAADAEGFDAIGCDDDPESVAIARRRLDAVRAGTPLFSS